MMAIAKQKGNGDLKGGARVASPSLSSSECHGPRANSEKDRMRERDR